MKRLRNTLTVLFVTVTMLLIAGCTPYRPSPDAIYTMILHPRFEGDWSVITTAPPFFRGTYEPAMRVNLGNSDLFNAFGPLGGPFQHPGPERTERGVVTTNGQLEMAGFRRAVYHVSRSRPNVEQTEQEFQVTARFGFLYTSEQLLPDMFPLPPFFHSILPSSSQHRAVLQPGTFNYLRFNFNIDSVPWVYFTFDVSSHEFTQVTLWGQQPDEDDLFYAD